MYTPVLQGKPRLLPWPSDPYSPSHQGPRLTLQQARLLPTSRSQHPTPALLAPGVLLLPSSPPDPQLLSEHIHSPTSAPSAFPFCCSAEVAIIFIYVCMRL